MGCPPQRIWVLPSARSSESSPKKQEPIYRDVLDRGEMVFFEVKDVVLPTKHHSSKRLISSWLQAGRLGRPAAAASEDVFNRPTSRSPLSEFCATGEDWPIL